MSDSPTGVYAMIDRLRQLDKERAALRARIADVLDETVADEAGRTAWADMPLPRVWRPGPGRPGQTPDGRNLVQVLESLLQGRTLTVHQLARAAREAGYITKSRHFRCIVTDALVSNPRRFQRVGWGKYTALAQVPAPVADSPVVA